MKTKTLLTSAVLLTSLFGSASAFAVTYDGGTKAKVGADVEFIEGTDPEKPVDPEEPDVEPDLPINPDAGKFGILYASDFNFGQHKKVGSGLTVNVLADKDKTGKKLLPSIQTVDVRGTDRKGWSLSAKVDGPFKDSVNNELKGAEIVFSKLAYKKTVGAPTVKTGELTLNSAGQEIATAGVDTGAGVWALGFGQLDAAKDTANGVTLKVPGNTVVNAATYATTITYELTAAK